MNSQLYRNGIYLSLVHFILTESTIIGSIFKHYLPFYSPSITSIALFVATLIVGFSIPGSFSLNTLKQLSVSMPLFTIVLMIVAISIDLMIGVYSGVITLAFAYYAKYILLVFVVLQAIYLSVRVEFLITPLRHIVGIILITGFMLFVLYFSGLDSHFPSMDVSYLKKYKEGVSGNGLYSMPLGLGLILTGTDNVQHFLGIEYKQFSSYYIEPSVFVFNVIPALLLACGRSVRYPSCVILTLALVIWANTLTAYIALAGGVVAYIWSLYPKNTTWVLLIAAALFFLNIAYMSELPKEFADTYPLLHKFSSTSFEITKRLSLDVFSLLDFSGRPFNLKAAQYDSLMNVSVFSAASWMLFLSSLMMNAVYLLYIKKNIRMALAVVFMFVASFKTLGHFVPGVTPIYVSLLIFAAGYERQRLWAISR